MKRNASKKTPRRGKSRTINQLRDEAARLFQKLRRMQEANTEGMCRCVTCGKIDHYKNMHGGHFIPRSRQASLLKDWNVWPQCPGCNTYHMLHGTAAYEYVFFMIEQYGQDFVRHQLDNQHQKHKWNREELNRLIDEYKHLIFLEEERIDGYDVVYRYRGQKYATRLPYDPGRELRVRVDVRPAG